MNTLNLNLKTGSVVNRRFFTGTSTGTYDDISETWSYKCENSAMVVKKVEDKTKTQAEVKKKQEEEKK